jgi:DNA-binding transcriptional MerR regulator
MNKDYLYAGELAKKAGVSTDTLRYYERRGVLAKPPRTAKGYRLYPQSAFKQVKLVRSALGIGFTIDEIAGIFQIRDSGNTPCAEVRRLAADKLKEVEERLKELRLFRENLRQTLKVWDRDLAENSDGSKAKLLEKLAADNFPEINSSPPKLKKLR